MPEFSEDAGVALSVNPIEGWTFAAKRAVYGAVNSMLAAGAKIKQFHLAFLCHKIHWKNAGDSGEVPSYS